MGNQQSTLWTKQEEKAAGNVGQGGQGGRGGQGGHGGKYRRSSLLWAVFSNREEEIDLLLAEKSVDVNAKDHKNNTALHHACLLPARDLSTLTKLLAAPGTKKAGQKMILMTVVESESRQTLQCFLSP